MNWPHDRSSQLTTKAEIDRLYFNLVMLIIAGLLLAFSLGIVVGNRMRHGSVKCGMEAQEKSPQRRFSMNVPLRLVAQGSIGTSDRAVKRALGWCIQTAKCSLP